MAEIVLFCPFLTIFKIVFIHPLIYLTISKYSFIHYFQLQIVLFGGNDYFLCALCSIHWLCILMYFSLVPQTNCQCSSPQPPNPTPSQPAPSVPFPPHHLWGLIVCFFFFAAPVQERLSVPKVVRLAYWSGCSHSEVVSVSLCSLQKESGLG